MTSEPHCVPGTDPLSTPAIRGQLHGSTEESQPGTRAVCEDRSAPLASLRPEVTAEPEGQAGVPR